MNLITGATARATVGFVMMPITIIKSMFHAARMIYAAHGLKGFFYGFGATAVRDAPYAGLYVYVYELSKAQLSSFFVVDKRGDRRDPSLWTTLAINFSSGLTAGFGATLLTNPFDVMRTRMQLRPHLYPNFWTAARRLYAQEGARSFLDGVGLRIARKSISSAFTWSLYEFVLANI
ncbi:Solute carrier family 25 member 38 homolog [Taphrina deformans PYCC 5710]|uniref:Solute carrier family 25 member 38 homolog n=1 Tax=Taphrina deformans (strain PYCC 5710 / ATCC 11124 / CBS 356.35 / IMI 108563 / JCM 9778 / NBRC 8474) TaxID=1097556 RepID=R4X7Z4_TAPDE|nr:Solute carrier family 25 member 38 homolog [Taphrina deformans PYCC 5710]|eukprot:CCG81564.1 Solute carrier family 25 member 38 homolog [Taphrina deformans PYCC 5710]